MSKTWVTGPRHQPLDYMMYVFFMNNTLENGRDVLNKSWQNRISFINQYDIMIWGRYNVISVQQQLLRPNEN